MAGQRGVVVTGAARGIGAAIATRLAAEGYAVTALDRSDAVVETVASLPGAGHGSCVGDAAAEALLAEACERAAGAPGGLVGFVANAGVARPGDSVDYARSDWEELLSVNLTAPFLGARTAYPFLRAAGGSVVMISSVNGTLGLGGRAAYCAAKAGLNGLVRSLAVEWGPEKVRVNAVAPGTILTEMAREFVASGFATLEQYAARVPMGHSGAPDDIAQAVAFLLSDASTYITGSVLPVDGGWAVNGV